MRIRLGKGRRTAESMSLLKLKLRLKLDLFPLGFDIRGFVAYCKSMNRWQKFSFIFLLIVVAFSPLKGASSSDILDDIVAMKHQLDKTQGRERVQLLSRLSEALLGRSVTESLENAQSALDLARKLNDPGLEATALGNVGKAQCAGGNYKTALKTFQELLELEKMRKERKGIAYAMNRVGFALTDLGRFDEALRTAEHQLFKICVAIVAMVFINGHVANLPEGNEAQSSSAPLMNCSR